MALDVKRVLWRGEWWRVLPLHQLVVGSLRELLLGVALLYALRAVERVRGSDKFAALVLVSTALHTALALALAVLLATPLALRTGAFAPVFGALAVYWRDVPPLYVLRLPGHALWRRVGGGPSDKWLVYALALQFVLCRAPMRAAPSALAGLCAGLLYRAPFMRVHEWRVPLPLHRLRPLLVSRQYEPPAYQLAHAPEGSFDSLLSALAQPLRQREQARRTRAARQRRLRQQREHLQRFLLGEAPRPQAAPQAADNGAPAQPAAVDVDELVPSLSQMGFDEQSARRALAQSNGNVEMAIELLLAGF